ATRAEAGLYHVGYVFGTGVKFFLSPFELAWSPFVYSLLGQKDAPRTIARLATYATAVLFALGLVLAVLAREILTFMTHPRFHEAHPVIPVVALAYVLQGLFIFTSIGIGISKKAYYYPILSFSAAAVNVGLNFLLIPRLGMMGAAWSTVAGYGLMAGLGITFSQRHYPIPFEWRRIGLLGLAGALAYGASLAAPPAGGGALAVKMLTLSLFPASLYVLGFFRREEITRLRGLLSSAPLPVDGGSPPEHPPH
ncbi:MAG: polysaccharide biosynthesis C-terminal domain-containing protein, partial [Acidobacteriota bacterium]